MGLSVVKSKLHILTLEKSIHLSIIHVVCQHCLNVCYGVLNVCAAYVMYFLDPALLIHPDKQRWPRITNTNFDWYISCAPSWIVGN